jgi:hypothetical protein
VENAAQFSPPHTKVRISGEPVGNGYALEIEDRGLGMGKEVLAEANRRLEESEALDLFDSDRLGLFVVSRLASRREIKVHLGTSPYGGTTAVVLLPTSLLQNALSAPAGERATPGSGEQRSPSTRHAPAPSRTHGTHGTHGTHVPAAAPHPVLEAHRDSPTPPGVTALRLRGAPPHSGDGELPRRVRQAHLVPQLREELPSDEPEGLTAGTDTGPERTPEQVRDRMTAYRNGWTRGGGAEPGTAAPGSEGDRT